MAALKRAQINGCSIPLFIWLVYEFFLDICLNFLLHRLFAFHYMSYVLTRVTFLKIVLTIKVQQSRIDETAVADDTTYTIFIGSKIIIFFLFFFFIDLVTFAHIFVWANRRGRMILKEK